MEKLLDHYDPHISHKFLIRVLSIYDTLKSAEKRGADTILSAPKYASNATITEIARKASCSDATLVRLAKKLGYSGYPELKGAILSSDAESQELPYAELQPDDSPMNVVDKVFSTAKQALSDTQTLLEKDAYEKALKQVIHAGRIFFIGAGDAYIAAYSAFLKFSRIGRNVGCSKDIDVQLIEGSKLTEQDLLVVISHSGRTESLYNVIKTAKLNNANVLAITNYPLSPIAKMADVVLLTAAFTPNIYHEIMAKRIPELCVIETLYINTLLHGDPDSQKILSQSNQSLSINKL